MNPLDYYEKLKSIKNRQAYADRAGCSLIYFQQNLFNRNGFKKIPRLSLIVGLVEGSEGKVSLDEAIDYFLVQPVKRLANESDDAIATISTSSKSKAPSSLNGQQAEIAL